MPLPTNLEDLFKEKKFFEELDLSERGITDAEVEELVKLIKEFDVSIDSLNLYRNNISGSGAIALAELTSVREIILCFNNVDVIHLNI